MKQNILKVGTVMGLLLLIGVFTSCNNAKTTTSQETQELGTIAKKEEAVKIAIKKARKPVVFIAGYDGEDQHFYDGARAYFSAKDYQIINEAYSLEEIINWMNSNATKNPYGEVHIVNYGNPWKGLELETVVKGERVTHESLSKNLALGNLPRLNNTVNNNTKIVFHSNALGNDIELMEALKSTFISEEVPQVISSPFYNVFGGEFTEHYLAKPYYVFYPTAHSPGKVDLSKEIARKYPDEREIEWFAALTNERERYVGEAYTKQFIVPIKWEFDYHNSDNEIPTFINQEELMDWIEADPDLLKEVQKLEIPVDKFRWSYRIKDSKLIIKGKTTVLCVLKPLTKPYGDLEHVKPDTKNKRLYAMK
ncbi:hypothetical protein [uncultured Tenacibaculum sp.]|uniref:hypothetical protein n=1 Tax=uncultured Tenacibaculum sp. TaxID=174713 RepID=UPI0026150549|nr:hypothetical protein [uncultured Tenacibaculum sp.]